MAGNAFSLLNRLIQHAVRPSKPNAKIPRYPSRPPPAASAIVRHIRAGDLRRSMDALASATAALHPFVYARLLELCVSRRAIVEARRVELHIITFFHPSPPPTFLLNRTIEALARCGSLADAREMFDEMPARDGGTWNTIIGAYTRADCPREAISLFCSMYASGIRPVDVTLASALGCCGNLLDLFLARQMHGLVVKYGYWMNVILGTTLVDVYGKCSAVDDARRIFDSITNPNDVSWNVIVRRYLDAGKARDSVLMFFRMMAEGIRPINFTISTALVACTEILALKEGCQIHGSTVKSGFFWDPIVANSLMTMYAKFGSLEDSRKLFELMFKDIVSWTTMVSTYAACGRFEEAEALFYEMPERNFVSWNAMLAGYVQFCCWDKALNLFRKMQNESQEISLVTLGLMLNVCAGVSDLEWGKQLHVFAYRHGFSSELFFSNALIDMYAKTGCLRNAEIWFLQMPQRDTISWNSLISGYARFGRSEVALAAFAEMQQETVPNKSTFSALLVACANIFMLEHGKQIHAYMMRNDFTMDITLRGALVDMYSKCRLIDFAIRIFEEVSSWDIILCNSMIMGCAYNRRGEYGLELFETMRKCGFKADNVTFIGILLSCISEGYVDLGRRYFNLMSEEYGVIPRIEHYECMIELLGKYGFMVELEEFIQHMPFEPTIPMWIRIFDCCREHGNRRLGEMAAKCINASNPEVPFRFEILNGIHMDTQ